MRMCGQPSGTKRSIWAYVRLAPSPSTMLKLYLRPRGGSAASEPGTDRILISCRDSTVGPRSQRLRRRSARSNRRARGPQEPNQCGYVRTLLTTVNTRCASILTQGRVTALVARLVTDPDVEMVETGYRLKYSCQAGAE